MALPSWNYVTLNARLIDVINDGQGVQGYLRFQPSQPLYNTINKHVVLDQAFSVKFDGSGSLSVDLLATDTPGIEPPKWNWIITEVVDGMVSRTAGFTFLSAQTTYRYADLVASGEYNDFSS